MEALWEKPAPNCYKAHVENPFIGGVLSRVLSVLVYCETKKLHQKNTYIYFIKSTHTKTNGFRAGLVMVLFVPLFR